MKRNTRRNYGVGTLRYTLRLTLEQAVFLEQRGDDKCSIQEVIIRLIRAEMERLTNDYSVASSDVRDQGSRGKDRDEAAPDHGASRDGPPREETNLGG